MASTFRTERDGRVLVVEFYNPPYHVLDRRMVSELRELVRDLEGRRDVRSVVFTGREPGAFPAVYDVGQLVSMIEGFPPMTKPPRRTIAVGYRIVAAAGLLPAARAALSRTPAIALLELGAFTSLLRRLERLDKIVIAAINGCAFGAGWEFALACDLRYLAADVPAVGQPEVATATFPGGGGTQRFSRAVGRASALEAILDPLLPAPPEALARGFVHRIVEPDRLRGEALETAHRLAARAPVAVAGVKRAVYEGASRPLAEGLAIERRWFRASLAAAAASAGRRSPA